MKKTPFLYLDLDGTVRYSKSGKDFIQGPDDVAVYDDVVPKLREYRKKGFIICGVSNQGGVAFGYKSENDVWGESSITTALTEFRRFSLFNHIVTCYAHPEGTVEEYAYRSLCRKPDIGMLVQVELHYTRGGIIPDYDNSLFVGDREEDRLCAERAGVPFQWANDFFGR